MTMLPIANIQNSATGKLILAIGVLAAMACSPAVAASSARTTVIPVEFQGNWYEGGDGVPACTPDDNSIMQVTADEFSYPLSGNTVLAVKPVELNVIHVTFRHQEVGDVGAIGRPRKVTEQWTLSHDEEHLLIERKNGAPVNGIADLFRCKQAGSTN